MKLIISSFLNYKNLYKPNFTHLINQNESRFHSSRLQTQDLQQNLNVQQRVRVCSLRLKKYQNQRIHPLSSKVGGD